MIKYHEYLNVGLIATRLNDTSAYASIDNSPPMSRFEERNARIELREGFRQLARAIDKPHIVLAPEIAAPRSFLKELQRHACLLSSICIFGVDYFLDYRRRSAKNEIVLIIPTRWPHKNYSKTTYQYSIYKTNPSPKEYKMLKDRKWDFISDRRLWLFDAGPYGFFGVANCFDFLDVEMHLLYKTKIQHLFVLSNNMDISSFLHTAESLCRTLYCNVVICNTGYYGGSVCISPYREPYKRLVYKHEGSKLFATQTLKLPVCKLIEKQTRIKAHDDLKELPPNFNTALNYKVITVKL